MAPQNLLAVKQIFPRHADRGGAAAKPGGKGERMDETGTNGAYRLDDQVGFKLRLAMQHHLEIFTRRMPEVTPTQFAVLARLLERGPLSQNHLGRLVGMDAATTKGVVDRLRSRDLVSVTPSTTDRRRLDIALTDTGRSFVTGVLPIAGAISGETLGNLTARESARLLALLDKL